MKKKMNCEDEAVGEYSYWRVAALREHKKIVQLRETVKNQDPLMGMDQTSDKKIVDFLEKLLREDSY